MNRPALQFVNKSYSRQSAVNAGLALALFLLASVGFLAFWNMQLVLQSNRIIAHTYVVIQRWQELYSDLKEAEVGQRGFLLTGDPGYIEPYTRVLAEIDESKEALKGLTGDNPIQQKRIEQLEPLIAARLALLKQTMEMRANSDFTGFYREVEQGEGKRLMDQIRREVDNGVLEERRLLHERTELAHRQVDGTRMLFLTAGALTFALFIIIVQVLKRELDHRTQIESELRIHRDRLSELVQERTLKLQQEIEGHKRAREALAASERRLSGIVGTAMDAIISVNKEQKVVLFNSGAEKLFGISAGEAVGSSLDRFIPERFRHAHTQDVQRFGRTGSTSRRMGALGMLSALRASGEEFPIEASISHLEVGGQMIFTVILRDVSHRVKAEEQLRATQAQLERMNEELETRVRERTAKLEEAVGELQHFSYTITHDMRAPLRSMRGYADLVMSEAPQLGKTAREYLERITVSTARMDKLITDALNYSRLVRQSFDLQPVNPAVLLKGMIESYPDFQPPKAHVRIREELPDIIANEAGLTQCFSNLLHNAIKFVCPGQTPEISIWAEENGERVRLWFEDNGIGIDPQYRERIFVMFQRLSNDYDGTGIGLALVRKAAERMDGTVGVESQLGQGSRFWLEFRKA